MEKYPVLTIPCFIHGSASPWGGTMLRDAFLKNAPDESTGESLEVSVQPGFESMVANGPEAGQTLGALAAMWGEELTGVCGNFPLTVKLLDAAVPAPENTCAFNRLWIVLNAEPNAELIFNKNTVSARPGNIYYIPGGTTAILGGGVQVYEACSTATCEHGNAVVQAEGATVLCKGGSRTYYVCDNSLELCRLNVSGKMPLPEGRMLALTPVAPCTLQWDNGELMLNPFDTVVVPAQMQGVSISGMLKVFMISVSDRAALKQELGYRADAVAGLL